MDCLDRIEEAVTVLRHGGVVAFPTESYFGLAVDPANEAALERLFVLKKRPRKKPILLITHHIDQLATLTDTIPLPYASLIDSFWPGPLTLVFKARPSVLPQLTADTGTIAVRISSEPTAQRLAHMFGSPITATSANISGMEAAVSGTGVDDYFNDQVDLIIEGKSPGGLGSTLVTYDEHEKKLKLLREGIIPFAEIVSARISTE